MRILNSLTFRIFAIFALTLTLLLVFVLLLPKLDSRQLNPLTDNDQQQGNMLAQQIQEELANLPNDDFRWWLRLLEAIEKSTPANQQLLLMTSEGRLVSPESPDVDIARNFIGVSDNITQPYKKIYAKREFVGPFLVKDNEENYHLYIIRPTSHLQSQFINQLFDHPILLLLVTLLISTPLLLWLAWSLAKPARKLKQAADQVSRGNLQERPELESGPIEFRAAGVSFNQMTRDLDRMIKTQYRFISDISHELRTPLTRLQLAAALMRRRYGESNELARIETESERLGMMINDLLDLSRNQYQNSLNYQSLQVDQIWQDVLTNALFEAEQLNKKFEIIHAPNKSTLLGDKNTLCSALENIIRNSFRYCNQHITVSFETNNHGLTIYVDDDGPGIAEQDLSQIFQPFYRTDKARDRASGGTGLGLAIVNTVINQHNGWVKAEKSALGGLRLIIWLPLYNQ